jgi:hypothetical protein
MHTQYDELIRLGNLLNKGKTGLAAGSPPQIEQIHW